MAELARRPMPDGTIAIRGEIVTLLDEVAAKLGVTRKVLAEKALLRALDDLEDEILAEEGYREWEADGFKTVSLEEILKDHGLES